jgi:saccharopine dehydrogenase (NAD+, L-lysine-forming)
LPGHRKHYLDITGEIAVFEAAFRRDAEARQRGCVVLPGVGFDVVPTDCLAAILKSALPDATSLELAFAGESRFSRGTAKTMLEGALGAGDP